MILGLTIYHQKITEELGFVNKFTIEDAVSDLTYAMDKKLLTGLVINPKYINIR